MIDLISLVFSQGKWLNYIIIIVVALALLLLINFFYPNKGAKKILLFFSVLLTAGIAMVITARKRNWTAEANKNKKEIDNLLKMVNKNNKFIEGNNQTILEKEQEKSVILAKEETKIEEIDKINDELDSLRKTGEILNKKSAEQDRVVAAALADVKKDTSFTSDEEMLAKLGLTGKRATVQQMVSDPEPNEKVEIKGLIEINGFTLKGDL